MDLCIIDQVEKLTAQFKKGLMLEDEYVTELQILINDYNAFMNRVQK